MNTRRCLNLIAGLAIAAMVGCMPEVTIEMMREMIPPRPVELDKLNVFVGEWTAESQMDVPGMEGGLKATGSAKWEWTADRCAMLERGESKMDDIGTMNYVSIWSYDTAAKKYRTYWTSNMGDYGTGEVTPCTCCGTNWKMTAKSKGAWGSMRGTGSIKVVDNNTMEWSWSERPAWDVLRVFPAMTMTGTSKRK